MDKYEYEQTFGERVIYCPIHSIHGIDGCIACDDEEREIGESKEVVNKCVTCGYLSSEDEFTTVEIKETGESSLVCQSCYDGYMKQAERVRQQDSMKATALADRLNTDYLD